MKSKILNLKSKKASSIVIYIMNDCFGFFYLISFSNTVLKMDLIQLKFSLNFL